MKGISIHVLILPSWQGLQACEHQTAAVYPEKAPFFLEPKNMLTLLYFQKNGFLFSMK
jgi:hypothetical protein